MFNNGLATDLASQTHVFKCKLEKRDTVQKSKKKLNELN